MDDKMMIRKMAGMMLMCQRPVTGMVAYAMDNFWLVISLQGKEG
jgi:hypothetical protein